MTTGYQSPDYLHTYHDRVDARAIQEIRSTRDPLRWPGLADVPLANMLAELPAFRTRTLQLDAASVRIGAAEELTAVQLGQFKAVLEAFKPWKKGPFSLFGCEIDAEWRSDWKWARIQAHKESLNGRRVADVGCGNGYFMLRMLAEQPELVVGFDPFPKWWFEFQLLQRFVQDDRLHFELLGAEHLTFYPGFFDTIFCLGVLYHHPDPVGLLRGLLGALRPGGELIVECQGIPGQESVALMPRQRYTRARGFWFLPTRTCLETWLWRAGLRDVQCFFDETLSTDEQRRTEWAPIDSLAEALDPQDASKTVEGYPAPRRMYMRARR